MTETRNWVFDLDDTLYDERDYVRSALFFVGKQIDQEFCKSGTCNRLMELYRAGNPNPIGAVWALYKLPRNGLDQMLQAMRSHKPEILLKNGAKKVLSHLRASGRPFAIVTDGRSVTQRKKITALGCTDAAFISISEEAGLTKMDCARFELVEAAFPPGCFCYVGDNPAKDFFAPRKLGWETFMIDHQGTGLHSQSLPADHDYHPDQILRDLSDLLPQL